MHIILYQGGGCGNMVSAVIDATGSLFMSTGHVIFDSNRRTLQQTFYEDHIEDIDRDKILETSTCKSIHSHSFDYHIRRKHDFIFIDCDDPKYIQWVCDRFNKIHEVLHKNTPELNLTPSYIKSISAKVLPHTTKVIPIADILEGRLLDTLSKYVDTPLNSEIYYKWLELVHTKFPLDSKNIKNN